MDEIKKILTDLRLDYLIPKFEANGVGLQEVMNLTDSEFNQLGVVNIGDRARLRQRCRTQLNGSTTSPSFKKFLELNQKKKNPPVVKKKVYNKIYCGWKHSSGSGYKHVPLSQGGGSILKEIPKECTLTQLIRLPETEVTKRKRTNSNQEPVIQDSNIDNAEPIIPVSTMTSTIPSSIESAMASTIPSQSTMTLIMPSTVPSSIESAMASTIPSQSTMTLIMPSTLPSQSTIPSSIESAMASTIPSQSTMTSIMPSTLPSQSTMISTLASTNCHIEPSSSGLEFHQYPDSDSDSLPDIPTGTPTITFKRKRNIESIEEILVILSSSVNSDLNKNIVNVSRHDAIQGIRRAFNRNSFNPKAGLSVKFAGENGMDDGGLTRELLQIVLKNIKDSTIFQGTSAKMLCPDVQSEARGDYLLFGKIMSYSIVHGGPSPKFFSNTLFDLIFYGSCKPEVDDICDHEIENSLEKMKTAKNLEELQNSANPLLPHIEFLGAIPLLYKVSEKERLIEILVKYFVVDRNTKGLKQLSEGLETLNLLQKGKEHPELMRQLFIHSNTKLTSSIVDNLFIPQFSDNSVKLLNELNSHGHWRDLLIDLEENDKLKDLLSFVTGLEEVPPLGFQPQLSLLFTHPKNDLEKNPFANTCANSLTIPVLEDYDEFKIILTECLNIGKLFTDA